MQNLIYALIQLVHNLGAVAVVGTAASALGLARGNAALLRRLALVMAVAWAVQLASGATFGVTSFYFEGRLPDIHGVAMFALYVKIICAILGFVLAVAYAKSYARWGSGRLQFVWRVLFGLGVVALSAAAFLRWFS